MNRLEKLRIAEEKAEKERLVKIEFDKKVAALRAKAAKALKVKMDKIRSDRLEEERRVEALRKKAV